MSGFTKYARPAATARRWPASGALLLLAAALAPGCAPRAVVLPADQHPVIDRRIVEYPANTELRLHIQGLTAPTAMSFDRDGALIVAEGGTGGYEPRIVAFRPDGAAVEIYPGGRRLPLHIDRVVGLERFRLYGPVGGLLAAHGRIYVSHRDASGRGAITAFGYDGSRATIVADLPAQGDHSVTDIAVAPNGRLYFGVGAATNSGVVGTDNLHWLRYHRNVCDRPWGDLYLLGRRFDTVNPFGGLLGGPDLAVTAPFQPYGTSIETRIPHASNGKPNAAIYSVDSGGGDLRVEAHGVRNPVGLGFSEAGVLYMTNQGMKLRGTRPVKDDPDVMLRLVHGQWYGWPDFSANLLPIREARFQPPVELIIKTGYRDLSFLIDHESSGLVPPNPNSNLLAAEFKPLAGASKFAFAPASGPFSRLRQAGNVAIVALAGDRAPFDTSGLKLVGPTGYRLAQVNVDDRQVRDFVRNTREWPASVIGEPAALERPVDVKFGPDGALYILDLGVMEVRGGREVVKPGTGRVFRLVGLEPTRT